MLVVHISYTPLAGAPIRIVNALNKYTIYKSRLININPNCYGKRVFPEDLIWEKDREEALELIEKADIIHLNHWMDIENNGFGINIKSLVKPSCKFIRMFHTGINTVARNNKREIERILDDPYPKLVIAQYHERTCLRAMVTPNIVPINDELYTPLEQLNENNNEKPVIFYSYTADNSGFSSRWDTKGTPEVFNLLKGFESIANILKITNTPFLECLSMKRHSDIVIDDIMTGSYHLTSLEALSQGKVVLSYLDNRTQDILKEITGAKYLPFVNVKVEEAKYVLEELCKNKKLRQDIGKHSRDWMEKYYNDRDMIKFYEKAYENVLNGVDISRPMTSDARTFLSIDLEDLIWQARKDNYASINQEPCSATDNAGIEDKITHIEYKLNKLIDTLAWWIPVRKWRDNFKSNFK